MLLLLGLGGLTPPRPEWPGAAAYGGVTPPLSCEPGAAAEPESILKTQESILEPQESILEAQESSLEHQEGILEPQGCLLLLRRGGLTPPAENPVLLLLRGVVTI